MISAPGTDMNFPTKQTNGIVEAPSSIDHFPAALAFTWETDNDGQPYHVTEGDPGGPTAWGVTFASFAAWRVAHKEKYPSTNDLKLAPKSELQQLIKMNYWNSVQAPSLPVGIGFLVYEFGFGSGPGTSIRILQEILEVNVDGDIGKITIAACFKEDRISLIKRLATRHEVFYQSLSTFKLFGRGWTRRNTDRLALALKMT